MPSEPDDERPERKNLLLRMLINEMLGQVRELQAHPGPWEPGERERARGAETLRRRAPPASGKRPRR